jgi:hypothetical protein
VNENNQESTPVTVQEQGSVPTANPEAQAALAPQPMPVMSPKKSKKTMLIVVVIAITLALIVGAYFVIRFATDKVSPAKSDIQQEVEKVLNSNELKEYVATEHGFKVDFPGLPQIERENIDVQGYNVPMGMYYKTNDAGRSGYFAFSWDYSEVPIDPADLSLEGGLNGMVQATSGKIISSKLTSFQGNRAIEGAVTLTEQGQTFNGDVMIFQKGKKMYGLMTLGLNKTEFEAFKSSLELL